MMERTLVALQFFAFAALGCPPALLGFEEARGTILSRMAAIVCVVLASLSMLWTVRENRPGNFHVRPVPKSGATLATGGPYRLVRHPMYASALLGFAGACLWWPLWWKAAAWLVLFSVLVAKARLEERGLLQVHPGYEAYRKDRRFLIPWLW